MRPGPDSLPWEGLQGTDSFFPWPVGRGWRAFYGSARSETKPIGHWLVGPAEADRLSGPWHRLAEHNPAPLETRFIENPIVTEAPGGGFLVVYDSEGPDAIGWAYSADGVRWDAGRRLRIQPRAGEWAKDVRTPLGLVPEGGDRFSLFYTASSRRRTGRECSTRRRAGRPAPSAWSSCGCSAEARSSDCACLHFDTGLRMVGPCVPVPPSS